MIDWTEVIIAICSIVITGVLIPLINNLRKDAKNKLTESQVQTVDYWTEVSVRWAKQWLQSETGEVKKREVLDFLTGKMNSLGIDIEAEDLDKLIEAVYERVKAETAEKAV